MIFYVVIGLICGLIGFYIGLFAGVYCFLRDQGMLPGQKHYQGHHITKKQIDDDIREAHT